MKKLLHTIPLWIIFLVTVGCQTGASTPSPAFPHTTASPSRTATIQPRPATLSTASTQTPSLTPTPSSTPTLTSSPQPSRTPTAAVTLLESQPIVDVQTIQIITPTAASGFALGKLVYYDRESISNYIWDLASGERIKILSPGANDIYCVLVNPNRTRLVCVEGHKIYLLDDHGRLINYRQLDEDYYYTFGWVNNSLVSMIFRAPDDYPYYQLNLPTTLYNVYTGEISQIIPDFAPISNLEPLGGFSWGYSATGVGYNPDLALAFFQLLPENQHMALWDRLSGKEIARVPLAEFVPIPQWSPDGQSLVVAGSRKTRGEGGSQYSELFILSPDARSQIITHLEELFPITANMKPDLFLPGIYIRSLGWSPNGSQIAFVFRTGQPVCRDGCFGVIDVHTLKLQLFRLNLFITTFMDFPLYRVEWSPDSRQLLLNAISKQSDQYKPILIFDLEKRIAYVVGRDISSNGWMK